MSEPNVLVSFRLDRETPARIRWFAADGTPGDGYKAQVTSILLADGTRLAMHGTSILEQTAADGQGTYLVSFTGMVGFAADHPDRARIEHLDDEEVDYELELVHEDGHLAVQDTDYQLVERPKARARKISRDA